MLPGTSSAISSNNYVVAGVTIPSVISSNNSGKKKSPDVLPGATTSSAISSNSGKKKSPNLVAGTTTSSASQTSMPFPIGPCLLGKHCFTSTNELQKKCPGC